MAPNMDKQKALVVNIYEFVTYFGCILLVLGFGQQITKSTTLKFLSNNNLHIFIVIRTMDSVCSGTFKLLDLVLIYHDKAPIFQCVVPMFQ